jgi:hypothetical protein
MGNHLEHLAALVGEDSRRRIVIIDQLIMIASMRPLRTVV